MLGGAFLLFAVGLLASGSVVKPGPPCGQETEVCFEHASCDNATTACICHDFFVMSGDWTKCLPVAAIPYDSPCEENIQCSARMGPGSVCVEGICVCKDGFHYLHGVCHKSSDYGEPCDHDDDCYGGYSYESLSCVGKKCNCSQAYYLIGRSDCRRKGNVSEECVFDMDCQFDNGRCNENECVNASETNNNLLSFVGNALSTRSAEVSAVSSETKLGEACETSGECAATTNNSECYGNTCVCKSGYSNFAGSCEPDLGESCDEQGDLNYITEAECRGEILRCKAPYIITQNNRMCRIGRLYGSQCQVNEQCMFSGKHAICTAVGNRRLCQCAPGYHFVDEIQLCSETKGVGEQCDYPYDCIVSSGNVDCNQNVCTCLEGFHATLDDCTPDVKEINDTCLATSDCTQAIPHSSCISSRCQCNSGYFEDPTTNNVCLTGIGGACTNDSDCSVAKSSYCDGMRCACDNGTTPNTAKSKCLEDATAYEELCEEDVQCYQALGQEGSVCLEGKCSCKDNYHFRSGFCREKRVLGEVCEENSQCYLKSNKTYRVECRNGKCQCSYSYTQTQDLDCASGVSNRRATFQVVTAAFVWVFFRQTKWN